MSELTVGFMRELHVRGDWAGDKSRTEYENEFDRWLDQVRREAKVEALTEAQQIIAGDMTIAEQRGRRGADKVDAAYLIQEFDLEIQELQESDHE